MACLIFCVQLLHAASKRTTRPIGSRPCTSFWAKVHPRTPLTRAQYNRLPPDHRAGMTYGDRRCNAQAWEHRRVVSSSRGRKPLVTPSPKEALCEVETDKATLDVEHGVGNGAGAVLPGRRRYRSDQHRGCQRPGEDVEAFRPDQAGWKNQRRRSSTAAQRAQPEGEPSQAEAGADTRFPRAPGIWLSAKPRHRGNSGTGPGGRIIERDVRRRSSHSAA